MSSRHLSYHGAEVGGELYGTCQLGSIEELTAAISARVADIGQFHLYYVKFVYNTVCNEICSKIQMELANISNPVPFVLC